MGGTVAFETSGGMGEQIFGIDSASDYFTLGETSGILSVAASVVVGEYAMTIWVQDETATLSITVVAEVGVPENLIVVGIPPLTITVGDVLALHTLQASGGLGTITYKMLGSAGHFFISEKSGVLRVNGGASEGVYMLSMEAADEAIIPQKATAVATVAVEKKKIIPITVKAVVSDRGFGYALHKFTLQYASEYSFGSEIDDFIHESGFFGIYRYSNSNVWGIFEQWGPVPEGIYTLSIEITYEYSLDIPPTKLISVVIVEMSRIPPPIKSQIYVLNSGDDVWSSVDGKLWTLKTARGGWLSQYSNIVVHNGRIYILDGYNGDVWSSDNGVNWRVETDDASWSGRLGSRPVVHNGRIYMLGGYDHGDFQNDVWSSADGKNWTLVKANNNVGWSKRDDHQAVSHNGRLYVLGGFYRQLHGSRGPLTYYNDVWSSADGKSWTLVKANNNVGWSKRSDHWALSHNGRLYVLGNEVYRRQQNDVWSSADGKSWTQETANAGWSADDILSHNGRLYALGAGWSYQNGEYQLNSYVWSSADGKNWLRDTDEARWQGVSHAVVFPPNLVLHGVSEFRIPNGHIGIIETFEAQYGDGNYIYSLLSDISGLSLSPNGELSTDGTTATGEHTITVQVADGVGQTATWTGKVIIICAHCNKAAK